MIAYKILKDTPFHKAGEVITKKRFLEFYGKRKNNQHFKSFFEEYTTKSPGGVDLIIFKGSMMTSGNHVKLRYQLLQDAFYTASVGSVPWGTQWGSAYISSYLITKQDVARYRKRVGTFNDF